MMVTGFLRVLASGVLLLLVTTTVFVQRADATTSATPTDGSGTTSSTGSDATPTDGTTGTTGTTGSDATPTDSTTGTTGSDAAPTDSTTDTTGTDAAPTDGTGTDEECSTEFSACQADEVCSDCFSETRGTTYEDCATEYAAGDFDSSTEACAGTTAFYCCADAASVNDCEANAAFVDYANCAIVRAGCPTAGEITCDDITGNASDGATSSLGGASTVIAFSCACIFLLPLIMA